MGQGNQCLWLLLTLGICPAAFAAVESQSWLERGGWQTGAVRRAGLDVRRPLGRLLVYASAHGSRSGPESASDGKRVTLDDIGADTPDLPDSAYTVPRGAVMYETSATRQRDKNDVRTRTWSTATLIRVGLAKAWELRISGDGYVSQSSLDGRLRGFGDMALGFKRHLSPERKGRPALGVIVQTSVPTARRGLGSGRMEPFASLNIGQTLPGGFGVEVNLGGSWLNGSPAKPRFFQGNLLWVVEREIRPGLAAFVHGQFDAPSAPGAVDSNVVGPGLVYRFSKFAQVDFSYTLGTTSASPNQIVRLGFAVVR